MKIKTYAIRCWDHEIQQFSAGLAADHLAFQASGLMARQAVTAIRTLLAMGWTQMTIYVPLEKP